MTFQNFVCWNFDGVQRVMNVEATQPPDYVFLATHHPVAMKKGELIKSRTEFFYNEQDFLKDFLATQDFAFVPVLGTSGTGKSHLIRWLAANIKLTDKRKVLLIPKIGTNLKDIIEMILSLEGTESEKFAEYHQRIRRATSTLTQSQAREQLLNQLAIAVGTNSQRDRSKLTDIQEYLIDELSSLLYDPFFREKWLKKDGIIHRLIVHTLGQHNTLEIVEERRQFSLNDLPLSISDWQKAGEKAREFYATLIGDDGIQKATVEWLNFHLDEAITQVLSLGREDLQRLMREVRETLAEQDIELVLLIEDFAKLQGIDREVLEAVLARPQQPGSKPLCAIRTALACTTGYFDNLIDTVQQRITFSINLDVGAVGDNSQVTEAAIQQFVVRYLNAVRVEDKELISWANSVDEDKEHTTEKPNFCEECEHRLACHAGFGSMNGIGLYPFTPNALKQMLHRVNPGDFNPRVLIKDVLKHTLENSIDEIQQGYFPTASLQKHFGNKRLNAIVQDNIRIKDPLNYSRREILIDLWTDSYTLVDLPNEIHTAFNLLPLGVGIQKIEKIKPIESKPSSEIENLIPDTLAIQLAILDKWNNKEILLQDVEKLIREFIYPAVVERIEWDTEMLLKGSFTGSGGKLFQQRNVVAHNPKVTRRENAGIVLSLPLNPDDEKEFRETAIAFQGILQYKHYKHWKFPNGDRYFRAYASQLERWSQYIVEEIRRRPRENGEVWNPVPATVELLAIAARMSGHSTSFPEDIINALFLDLEDKDEENRTKTWKELFKSLQKNRDKLLEIVKSRIACSKGNSNTFQIIDAVQILAPLKSICQDWQLKSEIPNDLNTEYQVIKDIRQKVDELLLTAIEEECDRQFGVYKRLIEEFGEEINKKDVIDIVKQAKEKAREAGVFGERNAENLTIVIDQFYKTRFGGYTDAMKRIQTEIEKTEYSPTKLLQHLSGNNQKAMNDTSEFLKVTNSFLDTSINEAQEKIEQLKSTESATVESHLTAIESGLSKLQRLLTEIKG
ncbi:MAG: hypothetical protein H0U45_03355 [Tatlockia sp.]|nr:hypothetical protein [Tatlockia sp.]